MQCILKFSFPFQSDVTVLTVTCRSSCHYIHCSSDFYELVCIFFKLFFCYRFMFYVCTIQLFLFEPMLTYLVLKLNMFFTRILFYRRGVERSSVAVQSGSSFHFLSSLQIVLSSSLG